jgi:hypothetical protein
MSEKGEVKVSTETITTPKIASRSEWLIALKQLLADEKDLTRQPNGVAHRYLERVFVFCYEVLPFPLRNHLIGN